jgi:hypothetical protein
MQVLKNRPATEEERRAGHDPVASFTVECRLEQREVTQRLLKAVRDGVEGVTDTDVAAADGGRPVREAVLRRVYRPQEMAKALGADSVTLRKSSEDEQELHPLILVRDVFLQSRLGPQACHRGRSVRLLALDGRPFGDRMD